MIYLLLIVMLFFVALSFYFNDFDVMSPAFLFSVSILLGVFFATIYKNRWDLNLGWQTFLVISGGTLTFLVTSFLIKMYFEKNNILGSINKNQSGKYYFIDNWKIYLFIAFEIFVVFYTIYTVVSLTDGEYKNVTDSIVKFRHSNVFSKEKILLPRLLSYSRMAVNTAGYWFSYVFVSNWLATKKIDFRLLMIIFISMMSSFILGGRNGMVNIMIALIASYFILINYQTGFAKNLNLKLFLKLLLVFGVLLISFESLAILIGRSSFEGTSKLDYLAVYIGAPVKNLDTFLTEFSGPKGWQNSQTFNHVVNWLGNKLHEPSLQYVLDLPFRSIDNQTLGNVYTTFYPYVYDFGYLGVPILIFIMSSITQILYEFVKRGNSYSKVPLIRNMVYSYIVSSLLLSFFSNKFYEQQFNTGFIQMLLVFYLFNLFFCTNTFEGVFLKLKKGLKK